MSSFFASQTRSRWTCRKTGYVLLVWIWLCCLSIWNQCERSAIAPQESHPTIGKSYPKDNWTSHSSNQCIWRSSWQIWLCVQSHSWSPGWSILPRRRRRNGREKVYAACWRNQCGQGCRCSSHSNYVPPGNPRWQHDPSHHWCIGTRAYTYFQQRMWAFLFGGISSWKYWDW